MLFEGFYSQMPFAWRYRSTIVAALAVFVFKRELSNFVGLNSIEWLFVGGGSTPSDAVCCHSAFSP